MQQSHVAEASALEAKIRDLELQISGTPDVRLRYRVLGTFLFYWSCAFLYVFVIPGLIPPENRGQASVRCSGAAQHQLASRGGTAAREPQAARPDRMMLSPVVYCVSPVSRFVSGVQFDVEESLRSLASL